MRAVMELYPDIGLQKDSFSHTPSMLSNYFQSIYMLPAALWTTKSSRRSFFDKLAQKKNFDPLIPGNWYSRTREFFSNEHVCLFTFVFGANNCERRAEEVF